MRREKPGDGVVVSIAGYSASGAAQPLGKRRNCHANLDDHRHLLELL